MAIHPTAIIEDGAEIGDADIGPFAVIEGTVHIHDNVTIHAHAVVRGHTEIGSGTELHPYSVIGGPPQDRKHDGSPLGLQIGEDNVFREFSSAHAGSSSGRGLTVIGDRNYFMASSHVAHDCLVGNDCMFANSAAIAGHVEVGDGAVLGGLSAVHQNCRIGRLAMVGGGAMCAQDVPPFSLAQGDRARLFGLNVIGLRRAGFDPDVITELKTAWRTLFGSGLPLRAAMVRVIEEHGAAEVREIVDFLNYSQRGVIRAAGGGARDSR